MTGKNKDKIRTLLAQIGAALNDSDEAAGKSSAATASASVAKPLAAAQLLENAVELSLQINHPEQIAALKPGDLPQFVSILSETAGMLFDLYRDIIKRLPPEAVEGLLLKLKVSKNALNAELKSNAEEIRLYADEIAEIQKQKLENEQQLEKGINNVDQMVQRVKLLENTLRLYSESNRRTINNLPRRLDEAVAKLESVEKMLGEVDDEMRKILEEHQHGLNVMQKLEA
ncbi:MAG: hypothetical protein M3384_07740 [Acidobacteriota bacterium]|nr:hypothetical protein [Acidobacteriota bacterium]